MRRLMLLIAAGSLWLFLAAVPVFADGGPHVAANNSGVNGINADSCAGCHRAHTAQGLYLLVESSGTALCTSCHGTASTGATTNVERGVQWTLGTADVRGTTALGYLRGGGFVTARIGSGNVTRYAGTASSHGPQERTKVPVRAAGAQPVTSAHLPNVGGVVGAADGVAWGNGPNSATAYAGPEVELECGTCHNPHGNGQYRILNPIPAPIAPGDDFVEASAEALVTDAALPPAGDTRNYTIIQEQTGDPAVARTTTTLLASQVDALDLPLEAGDYFRRYVPWNAIDATNRGNDAPNGMQNFGAEIATWCLTCHSRYLSSDWENNTGDAIFKYRHTSGNVSRNCITCHVAHGSNAQMTGDYSSTMTYPGGAAAPVGDSRLLKIDNRGTCQACHDPTGTVEVGTWVGPTPNPIIP